jgi:Tol biopolymer transport system component/DNA-binding winged helix-turn-helix (wHTH) protein
MEHGVVNLPSQRIGFGEFELDVRAGELRKGDRRIRLQGLPFRILLILLQHPGEVVTREQIRKRLWPDDTIVEFDHSIGTAIKKLRQALDDDAESPRYVETLPRRGFRFIFPHVVSFPEPDLPAAAPDAAVPSAVPVATPSRRAWNQLLAAPSFRYRLTFAAALVCIVSTIALLAWHFRKHAVSPIFDEASLTQVSTSIGVDIYPSLSPDGSAVAYSSDKNGSFEIYVKTLAPGGREIQLTSDGGWNFQPAWSPDGTQIAYFPVKKGGIWLIPALGGAARRLTEFGSHPAWSPDASRIVFESAAAADITQMGYAAMPPSTLWVVSAQGGTPTQLTQPGNPSGGHGAPSWSPDGKYIAFSSTGTQLQEVWTIPANGGTPRRLAAGGAYDPVYGPSGRYLYFSKSYLGSSQQARVALTFALMRVPIISGGVAGGEPELVRDSGSVVYKGLHFSANGRYMVFSAVAASNNLQSIRISPSTWEAIGDPIAFTHDTTLRKLSPHFSPDGSQIAWTVVQNGEDNIGIWVADPDGKNAHQLGAMSTNGLLPGWLPGGRLAFQGGQDRQKVIEAIDLNSGRTSVLREIGPNDAPLRISPDGKLVAYGERQGGAVNVWIAPINKQDGSARQLTFGKDFISYPCWSPDGKTIAIETANGLATVPAAGGPVTTLFADQGPTYTGDWAPDDNKIVFAGLRNGVWNIWWVSRSTRQEHQLTHYTSQDSYVRYPSWSPRGDQIVYEYSETKANIWTMRVK